MIFLQKAFVPGSEMPCTGPPPPQQGLKQVQKFHKLNADYASNVIKPTYPDGFDVEVMKFKL